VHNHEKEIFDRCNSKIAEHNLNMKIVDIECSSDNININFTTSERIDFKDWVKDLASEFKTRVTLKQVGIK
jgi:cell fate regulator YaaT (PSP1 superfamily)